MTDSKRALGIGWQINSFSGWGVLGHNLSLQLLLGDRYLPIPLVPPRLEGFRDAQLAAIETVLQGHKEFKRQTANEKANTRWQVNMPVIIALDGDFIPSANVTGSETNGIIFVADDDFSEAGKARARRCDRIVAGSSFCAKMVESAGVTPSGVWHQGIDTSVFKPTDVTLKAGDRFAVYSGGKLEYRKGQDLVIAAFREFHARHPNSLLICHWPTMHPHLAKELARSPLLRGIPSEEEARSGNIGPWLMREGLPENSFSVPKFFGNTSVPKIMRLADAALFPSRAEPGTNLVAMEAAACGVPVILSDNTGHKDLIAAVPSYVLSHQSPVTAIIERGPHPDWGESSVEEIVDQLEKIYSDRELAKQIGVEGAAAMKDFAWEKQVPRLLDLLDL